ncbi:VOC family protein [Lentzea sp.]|uniref:VOC family protein n=1 Tax=Lentzea sp. TaxID=56099 RepID=UPI0039C939E0
MRPGLARDRRYPGPDQTYLVPDVAVRTRHRRKDRDARAEHRRAAGLHHRCALFVADADEAFSQAVAAGGRVVTPLADNAFGQRGGRVKDPFGNIWWVVSCVEDVSEDEMWKRLQDPYTPRTCVWPRRRLTPSSAAGAMDAAARPSRPPAADDYRQTAVAAGRGTRPSRCPAQAAPAGGPPGSTATPSP